MIPSGASTASATSCPHLWRSMSNRMAYNQATSGMRRIANNIMQWVLEMTVGTLGVFGCIIGPFFCCNFLALLDAKANCDYFVIIMSHHTPC